MCNEKTLEQEIFELFSSEYKRKYTVAKNNPEMQEWIKKEYPSLDYSINYREIGYLIKNNIAHLDIPKCVICNLKLKFCEHTSRYKTKTGVCSIKCSAELKMKTGVSKLAVRKSKKTMIEKYGEDYGKKIYQKSKKTMIEKYGDYRLWKIDEFREKAEQTSMKRYGTKNPLQSQIVKNKIKETCRERYGVDYAIQADVVKDKIAEIIEEKFGGPSPFSCSEVRKKSKETLKKNYNVDSPLEHPEINKRMKQTMIKRYGGASTLESPVLREKVKQTNIRRYGTEYPLQNEEIKEKSKLTLQKKYGVDFPMHSDIIREKIRQTNLKKYGVENPSSNENIKEKRTQTMIDRYGVTNPLLIPNIIEKLKQTCLTKYGVENAAQIHYSEEAMDLLFDIEKLQELVDSHGTGYVAKKLGVSSTAIRSRVKDGLVLPPKGPSMGEAEIAEFLTDFGINFVINDRNILDGKEIDFLLPDHNIGIELNGLYFHTAEREKNSNDYHFNKWNNSLLNNVRLISFTDSEWFYKNDVCKEKILAVLGIDNKNVINSGETIFVEPTNEFVSMFFEENYLGYLDTYDHAVVLSYENEPIFCLTFDIIDGVPFIKSYCAKVGYHVDGALKRIIDTIFIDYDEIYAQSFNSHFTGSSLKELNFEIEEILEERSLYTNKYIDLVLSHQKDPTLNYDTYWDCGSILWKLAK